MIDTNAAAPAAIPTNGTTAEAAKPTAQRSSPYPSYTIQQSLELVKTIYESYGNTVNVTREQAAKLLGVSTSNIQSKMSTAVQYGFLTLKLKEGYMVSKQFIAWARPIDDAQRREALLTAFKSPSLYQALIARFDGNILPLAEPLANLLLQSHRIYEAGCGEAAKVFIDNANYLGLLDADKHLRVNGPAPAAPAPAEDPSSDTDDVIDPPAVIYSPSSTGGNGGNGGSGGAGKGTETSRQQFDIPEGVPITVALAGKRKATIYLPADATAKDCETVVKWVTLLKETMD